MNYITLNKMYKQKHVESFELQVGKKWLQTTWHDCVMNTGAEMIAFSNMK